MIRPTSDLVATKTQPPRLPARLVRRSALVDRVRARTSGRLTLISAPAGYGKTTLVLSALHGLPTPSAWVSLDEGDNDPVLFWRYLGAALAGAGAIASPPAVDRLAAAPHCSADALALTLVNELAARGEPCILVLDDYHEIDTTAVQGSLEQLVSRLPPQDHVIILSRLDPPLPLARLRARGELHELRIDDLRFTADEAAALLNDTMGLHLEAGQVTALNERTEGWAAGLRLAGLSLEGRPDSRSFVTAFGATHPYVLDYLTEEVLEHQDDDLTAFLGRTSVLDRLCAPLCDAVTGRTDSHELLRRAEKANLFLLRLDDEGRWYRYQRLFADLLRHRLGERDPAAIPDLHRRASRWFEHEGDLEDAARHALAAGDVERTGLLLERMLVALVTTGRTATVRKWLEALPDQTLDRHPMIAVWGSWASFLQGDVGEARRLVGLAGDDPGAAGALETVRAFLSRATGDLALSLAQSHAALSLLPPGTALIRSLATFNLAVLHTFGGDIDLARRLGQEALALARDSGPFWDDAVISSHLARVAIHSGRLHEAEEICRVTIASGLDASPATPMPVLAHLYVTLGEVCLEIDRLPEAEDCYERALAICAPTGELAAAFSARLGLSRVAFARGDVAGSRRTLEEAEDTLTPGLAPWLRPYLESWAARLASAEGDHSTALDLAARAEAGSAGDSQFAAMHYPALLNAARVRLAAGLATGIEPRLRDMALRAEQEGRTGILIEILTVTAEGLAAEGRDEEALAEMRRALALAEPEGRLRPFVDDGEAVARLLRSLAAQAEQGEYLGRLLAAFATVGTAAQGQGPPSGRTAAARRRRRAAVGLPAAPEALLSPRELEVVRLVAQGKSNREIAAELYLAEGTVKKHVYNVCLKLGAARRGHAVARARELGLL